MSIEKNKNNDEFLIRVNRKQLKVIDKCLDITARMHAGQLTNFLEGFYENVAKYNKKQISYEIREEIIHRLNGIKNLVDFHDNMSIGIGNATEFDKIAYDIYVQIRYFLEHEFGNPKSWNVYTSKHSPLSKNKEITIEKINPIKEKLNKLLDGNSNIKKKKGSTRRAAVNKNI